MLEGTAQAGASPPSPGARALSMGASDFIAKPFNAIETSLRVRNLLKMRRLYRDVTAHNRLLEQHLRDADAENTHMAPPRAMDRRHGAGAASG